MFRGRGQNLVGGIRRSLSIVLTLGFLNVGLVHQTSAFPTCFIDIRVGL